MFEVLSAAWGPQHWWPAESPFEVIAGAILVQNTAWTNAARALQSLRDAGLLSMDGIWSTPLPRLEVLVRSSGFYRQKAERLKTFVCWLDKRYQGSLEEMLRQSTGQLRAELLELKGFGQETVDSILLYAGHHEIFVVDAYARRILERHDLTIPSAKYDEVRGLVERALKGARVAASPPQEKIPLVHEPSTMSQAKCTRRAELFNEMHALLVQVGKHYCHRARALCEECPVKYDLPTKEWRESFPPNRARTLKKPLN